METKTREDNSESICGTYHNTPCVCTRVVSVQLPAQIQKNICDFYSLRLVKC